mgnify:CR=1 FL=1
MRQSGRGSEDVREKEPSGNRKARAQMISTCSATPEDQNAAWEKSKSGSYRHISGVLWYKPPGQETQGAFSGFLIGETLKRFFPVYSAPREGVGDGLRASVLCTDAGVAL